MSDEKKEPSLDAAEYRRLWGLCTESRLRACERAEAAEARVRLLEHVVDQVRAWHAQQAQDGVGYHADLHTILLQAKRDEEP